MTSAQSISGRKTYPQNFFMTILDQVIIYLGALCGVAGAIAAILSTINQRRKNKVDEDVDFSAMALSLLEPYKKEAEKLKDQVDVMSSQIALLSGQVKELEVQVNEVVTGAWTLHAQLQGAEIPPMYTPPRESERDAKANKH